MIAFVILHFVAFEMTCKCVDNLLNTINDEPIFIIVVDNGSANKSGEKLVNRYKNERKVQIVLNKENLGFAKGNNIGYQIAKERNPDFIIVMNNDVIIEDKDFCTNTWRVYNNHWFHVCGPDIYNPITKERQNPSRIRELSNSDLEYERYFRTKMDKHYLFYFIRKNTIGRLKTFFIRRSQNSSDIERDKVLENVVLHGACYIFSRRYIDECENAFNPNTFLYFEEDILFEECKRKHYNILYDPSLKVQHLEDVSTNEVFKNEYKKGRMKNHEMLKSINVLIELRKGFN